MFLGTKANSVLHSHFLYLRMCQNVFFSKTNSGNTKKSSIYLFILLKSDVGVL